MMFPVLCLLGYYGMMGANCASVSLPDLVSPMHARQIRGANKVDLLLHEAFKNHIAYVSFLANSYFVQLHFGVFLLPGEQITRENTLKDKPELDNGELEEDGLFDLGSGDGEETEDESKQISEDKPELDKGELEEDGLFDLGSRDGEETEDESKQISKDKPELDNGELEENGLFDLGSGDGEDKEDESKQKDGKEDESKQKDEKEIEKPEKKKNLSFTPEEKIKLLRLHNFYRSQVYPPAANMAFMEWNEELAELAEAWAEECNFTHFLPPHNIDGSIGQNLYAGGDPTGMKAVQLFYDEVVDYNFRDHSCVPGKKCGHYVQVVWAKSKAVGCGKRLCNDGKYYVACHYNSGVLSGTKPYAIGKPCQLCELGSLCYENTCMTQEQCERNPAECKEARCALECKNCGKLDKEKCECECADGWDFIDCSRPCTDDHEWCWQNPGFYNPSTCHTNNYRVQNIYCRKMCNQCKGVTESSTHLCCKGKICEKGFVLNGTDPQSGCGCKKLCPGPDCFEK